MDFNVRAIMLRFLETQKEYVRTDLANYTEAMVAVFPAKTKYYVRFPKFQDEESKIAAYSAIVQQAKIERAGLLITVNQALSNRSWTPEQMEHYQWGNFNESNADRCILLTASGPGLKSCSLTLIYQIVQGQVLFGEPDWMDSVEIGMLPGWPDETPLSSN